MIQMNTVKTIKNEYKWETKTWCWWYNPQNDRNSISINPMKNKNKMKIIKLLYSSYGQMKHLGVGNRGHLSGYFLPNHCLIYRSISTIQNWILSWDKHMKAFSKKWNTKNWDKNLGPEKTKLDELEHISDIEWE